MNRQQQQLIYSLILASTFLFIITILNINIPIVEAFKKEEPYMVIALAWAIYGILLKRLYSFYKKYVKKGTAEIKLDTEISILVFHLLIGLFLAGFYFYVFQTYSKDVIILSDPRIPYFLIGMYFENAFIGTRKIFKLIIKEIHERLNDEDV